MSSALNNEWKDCGLPLESYNIVKLEPGNEDSHLEFKTSYNQRPQRGYKKSEECLRLEAEQALEKKERKIMAMNLE